MKGAITRPKTEHRKPLSRDQIAAFIKALDAYGGYRTTVIALRLALLTFVRTVELRAAEWTEIDLDRAEWRIPAERMKMREMHMVPLSRQAVEQLRELRTFTSGQRWLFRNYRRPKTDPADEFLRDRCPPAGGPPFERRLHLHRVPLS